jgi:hypothetical protein
MSLDYISKSFEVSLRAIVFCLYLLSMKFCMKFCIMEDCVKRLYFKIGWGCLPLYWVSPQPQPNINKIAVANYLRCTLMYYTPTSIYVLLHFLMRGFICSRYTSYYTIHYSTQHVHNIYTMVSWWNWLFAHAIIWPTDTTGTMLLVLSPSLLYFTTLFLLSASTTMHYY